MTCQRCCCPLRWAVVLLLLRWRLDVMSLPEEARALDSAAPLSLRLAIKTATLVTAASGP
jgi:hypothetical protein